MKVIFLDFQKAHSLQCFDKNICKNTLVHAKFSNTFDETKNFHYHVAIISVLKAITSLNTY